MAGYGNGTDYFGKGSAALVLVESSSTPKGQSKADALDENGDFAGEGFYDAGAAAQISCTYKLISGTLDLSTLALGYLLVTATKTCVTSIEVSTSNGDWPTVKLDGFTGVTNETDMPAFTLDAITINGKKVAQGLDFSVGSDCRLTNSSYKMSGNMAFALNASGDVGAMAFTGAQAEISGTAVEVEGAITWTPGASWTETQGPGASNSNIGWGTSSFSAVKGVSPDA